MKFTAHINGEIPDETLKPLVGDLTDIVKKAKLQINMEIERRND